MASSEIPQAVEQGHWITLPEELTARVMSLLPVPALCTCRSVCKAWNELLRRPEFLERKHEDSYLFLTAQLNNWESTWVDPAYRRMTWFLDLDLRRWFAIGGVGTVEGNAARCLAMDDGLVCEFFVCEGECRVVVFDPVAKATRELPAVGGSAVWLPEDAPPTIVPVIDNVGFKVFLLRYMLTNVMYTSLTSDQVELLIFCCPSRPEGLRTGFILYESSTDAWSDLGNPVEELGVPELDGIRFAESAVYFQGTFYATFYIHRVVLLLSYNLEETCWKRVLAVESQNPGYPELIVFNNRMFMTMWLDDEPHGLLSRTKVRSGSYSKRSIFEIREILEKSSNSIVKIPYLELQRMFYGGENEFGLQYDIACGFLINSNSVVLVSRHTGKLIIYNVMSGFVCELPAHPLRQASLELAKREEACVTFRAKLMKLSLRNILENSSTQLPACVPTQSVISQTARAK